MTSIFLKNSDSNYSSGNILFFKDLLTFLVWFTPILVLYDNSNFNVLPSFVRQMWFVILFFVTILSSPGIRILPLLLIFTAFISIFCNDIPSFFKPYYRFFYFTIMLGAIGPLFPSKWSIAFNKRLWETTLYCYTGATILSFLTYLLKIGKCFDKHGNFLGILNHSMNLGPTSGVSCIFCASMLLKKLHTEKKFSFLWGMLFLLCLLTCFLTGSRSAVLSCLTSILFLVLLSPMFRKINFLIISLPVLIFVAAFSFNTLSDNGFFDRMEAKNEYALSQGHSLFFTRESLWQSRWKEFQQSPIVGIGFATVDVKNIDKLDEIIDSGNIEPGNSWLFAFSSMGILGGVFVLLLFFSPIIKLLPAAFKGNLLLSTIISIMFFYFIHMMAEGYLLSAGNLSFFLVWTTITLAWNSQKKYSQEYVEANSDNISPTKNIDKITQQESLLQN